MVVEKLSPSLCDKWKEYKRDKGLTKANLLNFEKWIEVQADVHEDYGPRGNKPPSITSDVKFSGRTAKRPLVYSTFALPNGIQYSPRKHPPPKASGLSLLVLGVMGDKGHHQLQSCPKFKALSVQERLAKVKEVGLCFRCFGRH